MVLWYCGEKLALPSIKLGTRGSEVVWQEAGYHRILDILKNPTYAGAYVHGRRRMVDRVVDERRRKGQVVELPMADWEIIIHDHHPGYIAWDQYLRNQEQLAENSNMRGQMTRGSAKEGFALLAGLIRCARCDHKLLVTYVGRGTKLSRYVCRAAHVSRAEKKCISFAGRKVDDAVVATVLEALQPAGVEAALDACDRLSNAEDERRRVGWEPRWRGAGPRHLRVRWGEGNQGR